MKHPLEKHPLEQLANALVVLLAFAWLVSGVVGFNRHLADYLSSALPFWLLTANILLAPVLAICIALRRFGSEVWKVGLMIVFIGSYTLLQAAALLFLLPSFISIVVVWIVGFVPIIRRAMSQPSE